MARLCEFKLDRGDTLAGIFHRWGDSWEWGPGDEKIPVTVAVVEEYESGKVYTVRPNEVTFFERPDPLASEELDKDAQQQHLKRLAEAER